MRSIIVQVAQVAPVAFFFAEPAVSGGFYLQEQSPVAIGRAFAGEQAIARDAGTVFFNPAGMTQLQGFTVTGGGTLVHIQSGQEDRGTTRGVPGIGQIPVTGGNGGNPFNDLVLVPSLHAAAPIGLDGRLWAGISVSAPFGLVVKYDEDWFGRYDSIKSSLITYNAQPSLAFRLSDAISVGTGLSVQYIDATLTNALPNLSPELPDGGSRIQGNDWSVGFNAGIMLHLEHFRAGFHYRGPMKHRLDGFLWVEGLLAPLAAANREVDAEVPITLPEILSLGLAFENDGWRTLFSANYYAWSRFDAIRVFDKEGDLLVESPQEYEDTFGVHGAIERDLNDRWTLRAGAAYDETPTTDRFRTTRVPDGDRIWATAGADYRTGPYVFSLSYAHVFVTEEAINRTDPLFEGTPAATDVTTRSVNRGNVDMVSLAVTRRF